MFPAPKPGINQLPNMYIEYSLKSSDVTWWKQGYIRPPPHTSFCETQWRNSVKTRLYKTPPPYFIVLASLVKTNEVKVIEFHTIQTICSSKTDILESVHK